MCNHIFPTANLLAASKELQCGVVSNVLGNSRSLFEGTLLGLFVQNNMMTDGIYFHNWIRLLGLWLLDIQIRLARRLKIGTFLSLEATEVAHLEPDGMIAGLLKQGKGPIFLDGLYAIHSRALTVFADEIRDFFRPVHSVRQKVQKRLEMARAKAPTLVGVHIRHGDYRSFLGGRLFFPSSHYASVMRQVESAMPSPVCFVICSNEPQDGVNFSGLTWVVGDGGEVEDLYLLAGCDYLISTASTYAQWASFYGMVPRYELQAIGVGTSNPPISLDQFSLHQFGYGALIKKCDLAC